MYMKNHYDIIGVNKNASTNEIHEVVKQRIGQLKQSSLNLAEKKKALNILEESYKFLSDYHSRKNLDLYLNSKKNNIFINSFFKTDFSFPEIIENKKGDSYYYSSSFTSNTFNKNGERVIEEKQLTNNNGKFNGKHTITTTDKEGNDIIKEVPINIKKDKKKLNYFIN